MNLVVTHGQPRKIKKCKPEMAFYYVYLLSSLAEFNKINVIGFKLLTNNYLIVKIILRFA